MLYDDGWTVSAMAKHLGCSKKTIYQKLYFLNMPIRARYAQISYSDLKLEIVKIHEEHPNAGQTVRFQLRLNTLFLFSLILYSFI